MMRRLLGLVGLLGILAVLIGIPTLLLSIGANPIPSALPSWQQVLNQLTAPDDGTAIIWVLTAAAWLAWAFLAFAIVIEIVSRLRGVRAPRLPGPLNLSQAAARGLVGAAALLFAASPLTASAQPTDTAPEPAHTAGGGSSQIVTSPSGGHGSATRTHVVRDGDSLWSIAEKNLGDGARYPEIAKLNYGRQQPDGQRLTQGHEINVGWVLRLPAPDGDRDPARAADAGRRAETEERRTVRSGDTLWSISEDNLGEGERYPEIFRASKRLAQPGGVRLTDPDQIRAGWTVVIPKAGSDKADQRDRGEPVREHPPVVDRDEPRGNGESTPPETAPPTTAPSATPRATPSASAPASAEPTQAPPSDVTPTVDDQSEAVPVRTASGVGALLAAGVIGLVAGRRSVQQRRRRHRARLPMPAEDAAHTEQLLRSTADPLSLATVDVALRHLARSCAAAGQPLPAVRAARLTADQFDLYLAEEGHLPEPWTGTVDATVWTLPADQAGQLDTGTADETPAPYPALVTVGHDAEDGHVLLDLEYIGTLGLRGDREASRATLAALAIELATSCWADDLQVTLVGAYPDLEDALQTGRIRYVPTLGLVLNDITRRAQVDRAALDDAQSSSLRHARVTQVAPDTWPPEILLIAAPMTELQRTQLMNLIDTTPRTAIAAITTDHSLGEWSLDNIQNTGVESGGATLAPIGLTMRPQQVDSDTYSDILDMVATASDSDQPLDEPTGQSAELIPLGVSATEQQAPAGDTVGALEQQAPAAGDTELEPDPEPEPATLRALEESPVSQAVVEPLPRPRPTVRILGPVELANEAGTVEPSKRTRLLEYAAYLVLNPKATHSSVDEAIWPNRSSQDNLNTRNTATSKLRRWLGDSPVGEPYLPRHSYTFGPDVTSDWAEFSAHIGADLARTSTPALERALKLVRGRPFEGVHPRHYAWAEPLRQEIISAVVDVSYELAHRRLMEGRWRSAEEAVVVGITLEPGLERLWRLRILAAHEGRNRQGEQEAIDRMLIITDELGSDLEPETVHLLAALRDPAADLSGLREAL